LPADVDAFSESLGEVTAFGLSGPVAAMATEGRRV
jgi:hypothetical protein